MHVNVSHQFFRYLCKLSFQQRLNSKSNDRSKNFSGSNSEKLFLAGYIRCSNSFCAFPDQLLVKVNSRNAVSLILHFSFLDFHTIQPCQLVFKFFKAPPSWHPFLGSSISNSGVKHTQIWNLAVFYHLSLNRSFSFNYYITSS